MKAGGARARRGSSGPTARIPAKGAPARDVRFLPARGKARGARDSERVGVIVARLREEFPEADCALSHEDPYQLLAATILSAQCTDVRVNQVTKTLFRKYPSPEEMAGADRAELEKEIRPTGFFRNKAKSLLGMAKAVVDEHGGEVPRDMEALTRLPGVGRKTANVVLGECFGVPSMVVDTHVSRVSRRLGWTRNDDPVKIERDLQELLPREDWTFMGYALILHGRRTCKSQRPRCNGCPLGAELCPSYDPKAPA